MFTALLLVPTLSLACIPVDGEKILMRDLAAVYPVFATLPPDKPVSYTPNPGAKRIFFAAELTALASRQGIALPGPPEPVCFVYRTHPPDASALAKALREGLGGDSAAVFHVVDNSRWPIPEGHIEFLSSSVRSARPDRQDGTMLYRGLVRYARGRTVPLWVRASVEFERPVVVAAESLPAGAIIRAEQLRIESRKLARLDESILSDPAHADGMAPRRAIAAGTVLDSRLLTTPRLVATGDTVDVDVQDGGTHLTMPARAESGGRAGDKVFVRNLVSGKRFPAVVASRGHVVVNSSGGKQ